MWICSQLGFFSIVADTTKTGNLLVRARDRGHLDSIVHDSVPISHTPSHDYPWRVSMPKEEVASIFYSLIESIDYPNFKARVDYNARWRDVGPWYAQALHRVWDVMYVAAKDRR